MPLTREYLEDKITKARDAIAFASPRADLSYAKATLVFAEVKLAALDTGMLACMDRNNGQNDPSNVPN